MVRIFSDIICAIALRKQGNYCLMFSASLNVGIMMRNFAASSFFNDKFLDPIPYYRSETDNRVNY